MKDIVQIYTAGAIKLCFLFALNICQFDYAFIRSSLYCADPIEDTKESEYGYINCQAHCAHHHLRFGL